MPTMNGKARRRVSDAELRMARLNVNAMLLRMDALPAGEREEWQDEGREAVEKLRLALREVVERHFPAATAAAVVIQPVPGGPSWVTPMAGNTVPSVVDCPDMSFAR